METGRESAAPALPDPSALAAETQRVYDICAGCRRCYNLCPSFTTLLDVIDEQHDGEATLTAAEQRRVVDLCFSCKLCYPHCPYTPPHRWGVDFPRLMQQAKIESAAAEGIPRRERLLANPERIGRLASLAPALANWAARNRTLRALGERWFGIDRRRTLPRYEQPFHDCFLLHSSPAGAGRNGTVALFVTTPVEYNTPCTGRAAVRVLWRNGVGVRYPVQVCCGMPALDGGDVAGATRRARANIESLDREVVAGCDIVVPGPTCSRMLKVEYPRLVPGPAAERVAGRVFDLSEYLVRLHVAGTLDRDFRGGLGRVAYHAPCHLRVQEIGFKARDVLRLVPDTSVDVLERCAGMDGTWGFKREFFDASLRVAQPLLRDLDERAPDLIVSDCPLAALQLEQQRGRRVYHPIEALDAAYEGRTLPAS